MKRLLSVVVFVVGVCQCLTSQEKLSASLLADGVQGTGGYPMKGCQVLREEDMKLRQYLREHPEALDETQLMKRTAWTFQVGDKGPIQSSGWWATNLETNSEYLVPSTCRAVGVNCYIFVEDAIWLDRVDQVAVDSIVAAWDLRTPANSSKGIYQTDVETFGNPPNVDNDPKIIILILDIRDGYSGGTGGFVAGYFFGINQYPDGSGATGGHRSNFAEIYYVDANPLNLKTSAGRTLGMQTAAHEFQHMINWNYNKSSDTFNNEACSQVAEIVCGYPYSPGEQARYTDNTDVHLLTWNGSLADYSRGSRWALYLWNQFPNGFLAKWVQNTNTGVARMNSAFVAYQPATSRRFDDVFVDWLIANQLQDISYNPRYGYTFSGSLTKPKAITHVNPNTGQQSGFVSGLAADYISFTSGSNLSITFTSAFSNIAVKAVKVGASGKVVQDVPLNVPYSEPSFGSTYSTITFVVINTSQSPGSTSYGYQATGTAVVSSMELKWDTTEPTFYYRLPPLDTVCVQFDAVPGARLDSVRVALRRAGSMNGGVWTFTGASRPTPLGMRLAFPISVSTTLTPPVVSPGATYPYPIPYPNWRTIDLRSYAIQTNQDFVVGFWMSPDTSRDAYVMATTYPSSSAYHSFTYLNSPSSGTPGWYYIGSESEISLWLIRAYVSTGTTGAEEVIELLPKSFTLHQNYPNPFNPNTTIRYDLPAKSHVKLEVVDVLGRVVATLVDKIQDAGSYEAIWDGKNLSGASVSSGVYFYRLESSNYRALKKMVLLR
jgi:hypothetical protein